jgi:hypothetical protein
MVVVAVLALAQTLLLARLIDRTDSLTIEQKRATCYARLTWLTPDPDVQRPLVPRSTTAQHCEGDDPRTEFGD